MLDVKGMPYFLENDEWYTVEEFPADGRGYRLTDKAPQKAVDSYNEFYKPHTVIEKGENWETRVWNVDL